MTASPRVSIQFIINTKRAGVLNFFLWLSWMAVKKCCCRKTGVCDSKFEVGYRRSISQPLHLGRPEWTQRSVWLDLHFVESISLVTRRGAGCIISVTIGQDVSIGMCMCRIFCYLCYCRWPPTFGRIWFVTTSTQCPKICWFGWETTPSGE